MPAGVWRMVLALFGAKLPRYFETGKMGLLGCLLYACREDFTPGIAMPWAGHLGSMPIRPSQAD